MLRPTGNPSLGFKEKVAERHRKASFCRMCPYVKILWSIRASDVSFVFFLIVINIYIYINLPSGQEGAKELVISTFFIKW